MAKTQIKNYVFKPGIGSTDNLYPDAYNLLQSNKLFIQKEATQWIQDQIDAGTAGFVGYTYNDSKCERDIGYNLDAYLKDLRYGGNENTINVIKYYWDQDVAQIDGDRQPEIQTYGFIDSLIQNYILTNVSYPTSNTEVSQTIDLSKTAETEAFTVLDTLLQNTIDVITNGLDSLPALVESGVGKIKIQGRYDLEDILLITNTTKNEIVYNFSNSKTGGSVEFKTDGISEDPNFVTFLQTTDAVTVITLNYNTATHSASDELQIFIEKVENGRSVVTTRPYDFGTDAIERMRVAQPLSMLDADFEYGLQPTKWAAIGTMRGYPSVYEVPGTDTSVLSVVTDASAGTDGIGQSLITVTTVSAHGFTPGTPITIKALEDAVVGAARAEGSFVIVTVPTNNTFTYFAKSKVGTTNGDVLSTTYTQLREAGFYTGADIGSPTFSVLSQGSAGTIVTELAVATGSTIIPFDGQSPEIGSPLIDITGAITTGTQVTQIIDNSAGGGTFITPQVIGSYPAGSSTITVDDATGIVDNLAVDRGDGTAIFIESISGNDITFNNPFTATLRGNIEVYSGISGANVLPEGSGATFDVSRSAGVYTVTLNTAGTGYIDGDRILILGTDVGGTSPDHDITILVTGVTDGAITSFDFSGTAFDGTATVSGLTPTVEGGEGTGALFDITFADNVYQTVDVTSPDTSENYKVDDIIIIPGDQLNSNGTTPTNDAEIRVTSVSVTGAIISATISGTAPDAIVSYDNPLFTTSGTGTGIDFVVVRNGQNYSVNFNNFGTGFAPADTITVTGDNLGGATPTNDLTITVDNVGGLGEITAFSVSGIAVNSQVITSFPGNNLVGTGFNIDVNIAAGTYSTVINSGGTDYRSGQTFTILGTTLIGETPTNDLTITIDTVDATGAITAVTSTGTANGDTSSHTNISGTNIVPTGAGATFDITRDTNTYSATIVTGGNNYAVGNRLLILGGTLGGTTPDNNLELQVDTVSNGSITAVSLSGTADSGEDFDLICTVVISEATVSNLADGVSIDYASLATLEIGFANAHGLVPGNTFIVTIDSDDGVNNHNLAAGSFFATEIPTVNTLRFQARAAGAIDTAIDSINGEVYARPDSFFIHRPFDGGVQLGTGGPQHGAQAIRQSKKYIRYQSGKGIMYTTGALFAPSYDIRSVTADGIEVGSLITIETDDNDHGVQQGGIVRLLGIETPGYNSGPETAVPPEFDYEVTNVLDERRFQVRSKRRLGSTTATIGFGAQMSVVSWHGATVRSGIFDDQNGIFWEFDGTQISVVQRTGTQQLAGTISLEVDNNLVTGLNTRFRDQIKAGDRIIIKGMTHVVSHVNSQTEITVTPDWRGVVNITGSKANLVVDKKVKQRDFNLDRLDGTGPSGYDIDIAKMQMIGIQYSWYGAGFIDFMLRGADGNFVFAHRMRNSNVNTEAFMRSGNLPVRYEVTNEGPSGKLQEALDATQTTALLEDASFFPESGTVYIDNEIMSFDGKDGNTLTNLTRSAIFTNFQAGAERSYTASAATSHVAKTGVVLISQTITPLISHWGSAFITDGLFDDDRGYLFTYAESSVEISTTKQTAFMIRLSPSVSNALIGDLGERELLNRAQLLLQGLEITSDGNDGVNDILGGIVVEGILNPQNYPLNPSDVKWSGLSGVAQGGQPSFAQIAGGGGITWSTGETATTASATQQANLNAIVTVPFGRNNDDFFYAEENSFNASGAKVGDFVIASAGGATFGTGIRIRQIDGPFNFSTRSYIVRLDNDYNGTTSSNVTIERRFTITDRNFATLTTASFNATGAVVGTTVVGGTVSFPANTQISSIELESFGGVDYYEVNFNNSFNGTLTEGVGTVQFEFSQPPFARPGETVFSFVAQPGERATLDLSSLKELTNTPLGGRGTYPNGPDVLAINVYKVSGAATTGNIILRWGEAQA